jgi:hypothetical protein
MGMVNVEELIFSMRHRVVLPAGDGESGGDGTMAARQVDAVLLQAGFKCSAQLLTALGARDPETVIDLGARVIGWARELVGDHVRHNAYFIDFPANVPGTLDFWLECLRDALADPVSAQGAGLAPAPRGGFFVNLLSLPKYGRYQHTYEEMLTRHDELIPALSDRVTVLHLGGILEEEAAGLYAELAGSTVPLNGEALAALRFLAEYHGGAVTADLKVRENKAVINAARVRLGLAPEVDTPTDVLRIAVELSDGDPALATATSFRSLPRAQRRVLLAALDRTAAGKLADVSKHAEQWKRLGERLHPHEWPAGAAREVFAVARGELAAPSLAAQVEAAFADGDISRAVGRLAIAPGMLWRAADRVLRAATANAAPGAGPALSASPAFGASTTVSASPAASTDEILEHFAATAPKVSGRVLLSVREHLQNRIGPRSAASRIFVNRKGRAWAVAESRDRLSPELAGRLLDLIDTEVESRLPAPGRLIIDPAIETVALPLSGKAAPAGLRVFPRGSVTPVEGDLLRFFVYWKQASRRTDFDLSALITDEQLGSAAWLSYTNLANFGGEHSGDITSAPDGATEFINVHLDRLGRHCVIPQVYVYSGEGFGEVEENFFGFMTLGADQGGAPFEPRTVRARSGLAGDGRVAMPLVFYRGEDGRWYAKWLHLYLRGQPNAWGGARVEENRVTSKLLTQSILDRDYLRVGYLAGLLHRKASHTASHEATGAGPVTYIGVEQPGDLPPGSTVYTLANLASLIPE